MPQCWGISSKESTSHRKEISRLISRSQEVGGLFPSYKGMDAFVVKTKRQQPIKINKEEKKKKLKQVTIEALPRVVVVEDIERLSLILQNSNDAAALHNALEELSKVKPSKEILLKTKIGHIVNKLRKHEDSSVQKVSRQLFHDWKKFYKEQRCRPVIEVRSDAKSELTRMKARKLIAGAVGMEVTHNIPEMIEREVFKNANRKIDVNYKRRIRKLVFDLRNKQGDYDKFFGDKKLNSNQDGALTDQTS
ncbi:transcription elongation factor A N-terminal and central domain-containing protein 2-like [Rhopilema esculentum]|uniref:transcription elongation factor A N-terminal and central domain-containing protein 2-like n=1 Tax=Rhopilema esculentum TaxID=499914 RepID=UPI0031D7F215